MTDVDKLIEDARRAAGDVHVFCNKCGYAGVNQGHNRPDRPCAYIPLTLDKSEAQTMLVHVLDLVDRQRLEIAALNERLETANILGFVEGAVALSKHIRESIADALINPSPAPEKEQQQL